MKIAIYGDSFACEESSRFPKLHGDRSWIKILKDLNYNITCYGLSGTSLFWSYLNFINTSKNFDKIIFIATDGSRLYIPTSKTRKHWVPGNVFRDDQEEIEDDLFESVLRFYRDIWNPDESTIYRNLILKDLGQYENVLLIDTTKNLYKPTMNEITHFKIVFPSLKEKNDNRYCHLSQEGNIFFAEQIESWLERRVFKIDESDWPIPQADVNRIRSYFPES